MTADERSGGGHTVRRIVVFVLVLVVAVILGTLGSGIGDGPAHDADRRPTAGEAAGG